ncbi:MAG: hypothetical protein KJP02_06625 [Octadecabacter sp.]|nr:hypothetical protein [Octadecabacter sp.]
MISNTAFVFVVLPCIGAVLAGALLFDWRLAAAALCGALAVMFALPALSATAATLALPVLVGVALGALVVLISLLRRPSLDVWSRMIRALLVAFAASFLNLLTVSPGA